MNALLSKLVVKVGIGVTNPTEKLEVNGAIVVGNAAGTGEGTIFYHDGEFKGITGREKYHFQVAAVVQWAP